MNTATEYAVTLTGQIIYYPEGSDIFAQNTRAAVEREHGEVSRLHEGQNIYDKCSSGTVSNVESNINAGITKDGYIVAYPDGEENEEVRQRIEAIIGKVSRVQYGDNILNKISEAFSEFCNTDLQKAVSGETGNISKL